MDTLIEIGSHAPDFSLPDLDGNLHSLMGYRGAPVLVNFWSAECPYTERTDRELAASLRDWGARLTVVRIASNANESPDMLREVATQRGLSLVLHDVDHRVADLYGAQTTPHCFLLDGEGILRYQGAFDDVTFRQRTPQRLYLKSAVEALLRGETPNPAQIPPYGCVIVRFLPGT
jgi:peroxiredoxin